MFRVSGEGQKEDLSMVLQNKEEEGRDWSELPNDIIGHIVWKLYWSDRIRMRAVCKSWQQATLGRSIPTIDKAAWLFTYHWLYIERWKPSYPGKPLIGIRKLRDTSLGRVINIDKRIGLKVSNILCVTSRYGWVLFRNTYTLACQKFDYLLYSPFTDEVIELPTLDLGFLARGANVKATFYLSSKDSECVVFNIHVVLNAKSIVNISACRPGDRDWKTYRFLQSGPLDGHPLSATCLGGRLYCVFTTGALGVFDIRRKDWELIAKRWPRPHYSFSFGELIGIPRFPCKPYKRRKVMKFDLSIKRWVVELNIREMVHPDLRFLSSSQPSGQESSSNHYLYAYIYSTSSGTTPRYRSLILIEPPFERVWTRHHLLHHN